MLAPGTQIGSYFVEAPLGQGGMAAVFRARHVRLGSVHALKVLLPDYARSDELRLRFLNEGRIQAQLRHPGLVPVTDLLEADGVVGLVMDLVDGRSLDVVIRESPSVSVEFVREVFLQVLPALGYVHARGVVHRDLKPSNVMLDERDGRLRARILDFGIAKLDQPDGPALTQAGMTLGTLRYMSAEQIRGERVDARSDVFSLGVMLYELCTGRLPFQGDSQWHLQQAIVNGTFVPPETHRPELTPVLAAIIRRALANRPEHRWPSCEAFAQALDLATRPAGAAPWVPPATTPAPLPPPTPVPAPPDEVRTKAETPSARETLKRKPILELDAGPVDEFQPRRPVGPYLGIAFVLAAVAGGAWYSLRPAERVRVGPSRADLNAIVRETARVEPKSGLSFVRLPGGEFQFGCEAHDTFCEKNEPAARRVRVDGFWLGTTEVTVEAWEKCVRAGACSKKPKLVVNARGEGCNPSVPGRRAHPVNCVSWDEAKAFCDWTGGRLPHAEEWEFAAKSGGRAIWPWGDTPPTREQARFVDRADPDGATAEVAKHAAGVSKWGLHDLAGNLWEWTADRLEPGKPTVEARGGSWKSKPKWLRTSNRFGVEPEARSDTVGFRCAADATSEG